MFDPVERCPFEGLLHPVAGAPAAGVWAQPLSGRGVATVLARKEAAGRVAEAVQRRYGLDLPQGPARAAAGEVAFVGTAPGVWMAVRDRDNNWAAELAEDLAGTASVVDQGGGLALLRLGGARSCDVLAKGLFLDLHPGAFPPGASASSVLAHVAVTLWRTSDTVFELVAPRSYVPALAHWLMGAAAEFGLELRP